MKSGRLVFLSIEYILFSSWSQEPFFFAFCHPKHFQLYLSSVVTQMLQGKETVPFFFACDHKCKNDVSSLL